MLSIRLMRWMFCFYHFIRGFVLSFARISIFLLFYFFIQTYESTNLIWAMKHLSLSLFLQYDYMFLLTSLLSGWVDLLPSIFQTFVDSYVIYLFFKEEILGMGKVVSCPVLQKKIHITFLCIYWTVHFFFFLHVFKL